MATLQTSGPISFGQIAEEFRPGYTGPVALTAFYRDGMFVPGGNDVPGQAEQQQITAMGITSNTPNQDADRNQQYLVSLGRDFSTVNQEMSEAGTVNLPLTFVEGGNPLGVSGVTLGNLPVAVSGSGNDTNGSFDLAENSPVVGDRAVTIEVSTQAFGSTEVETITQSGTWTPRFPGRAFTIYVVGAGGGGAAAVGEPLRVLSNGSVISGFNYAAATGGGSGGVVSRHFPGGLTSAEIRTGAGGAGGRANGIGDVSIGSAGTSTRVSWGTNQRIIAIGGNGGNGVSVGVPGSAAFGANTRNSSGGDVNLPSTGTGDVIARSILGDNVNNGGSIDFPFTVPGVNVSGTGGQSNPSGNASNGNSPGGGGGAGKIITDNLGDTVSGGNGSDGIVYVVYEGGGTIVQMRNVSSNWSGRLTLSTPSGSTSLADSPVSIEEGQEWTLSSDTLYSLFVANTNSYPITINGVSVSGNFGLGNLETHQPPGNYDWTVTGTSTVTGLPTFSLNLDADNTGTFTNPVTGTFTANITAAGAIAEIRNAVIAEYPALTVGAVQTGNQALTFTIDTGQTGNLNATLLCVENEARGVDCSINSMFITGNEMEQASIYSVRDYLNRETLVFTHVPTQALPNRLDSVLREISTSITNMTETPVNFNANVSGNSIIITAVSNAEIVGLWSVSSNHFDGTGNIAFGTAAEVREGLDAQTNLNSTIPTTGAIATDNFYGTRRLTDRERS